MLPPADPPASASDALNPPDPERVERFRRNVETLTGEAPTQTRKLGLAVSGGPDSMALLALAAAAYRDAVCAATVDHGLRPAAADEAAMVAQACDRLGVPHNILALPANFAAQGNVQSLARAHRYHALHEWAGPNGQPRRAAWVAVAHHRDDVAETFLMRARRGSGVGGLAAMKRARPITAAHSGVQPLIRPLLDWSREELATIVAASGLTSACDASNTDLRYDRARIRALLAQTPDLPPARLALAAQNLRHAEDALEWLTDREAQTRIDRNADGIVSLDPGDLPYELRRRLVRAAIDQSRRHHGMVDDWDTHGTDRLVATLDAGGGATLAGVQARVAGKRWYFAPAPPRRSH